MSLWGLHASPLVAGSRVFINSTHNLGVPACYVISCNTLDDGRCRLDAAWEELLSGTHSYVCTCINRLIFGSSWFHWVWHQTQFFTFVCFAALQASTPRSGFFSDILFCTGLYGLRHRGLSLISESPGRAFLLGDPWLDALPSPARTALDFIGLWTRCPPLLGLLQELRRISIRTSTALAKHRLEPLVGQERAFSVC